MLCVCVMSVQVSIEAEEGMKFPETGVTGGFKPGNWTHSLEEQLILSQLQCPSDPPASISPVLRLEVYDPLPVHGVLGTESRASCMLGEAVRSELHPQVFSVVASEILLKQVFIYFTFRILFKCSWRADGLANTILIVNPFESDSLE